MWWKLLPQNVFPQNVLKKEKENQYKTKKPPPSGRGLIIFSIIETALHKLCQSWYILDKLSICDSVYFWKILEEKLIN